MILDKDFEEAVQRAVAPVVRREVREALKEATWGGETLPEVINSTAVTATDSETGGVMLQGISLYRDQMKSKYQGNSEVQDIIDRQYQFYLWKQPDQTADVQDAINRNNGQREAIRVGLLLENDRFFTPYDLFDSEDADGDGQDDDGKRHIVGRRPDVGVAYEGKDDMTYTASEVVFLANQRLEREINWVLKRQENAQKF